MSQLKVLFSSTGLKPSYGGPAFSESILCAALQKRASVTVLVQEDRVDPAFVSAHNLSSVVTYRSKELWKKVPAFFKEADIFHLNGHWKWEYYVLSKLSRQASVPYLLHPRGMLLMGHRKLKLKRFFNMAMGNQIVRHASRIIALSVFETGQFVPYQIPHEKLAIVPNPIVPPLQASAPAKEKLGFLYLGRIESRKNLIFLLQAYKKYLLNGGDEALTLIGPVEHGYDRELNDVILRLELKEHVTIKPPVFGEEKWSRVSKALAMIYPAVEEPFGRVPFEAITVDTLPVVSSRSGTAEYIKDYLPQCIYNDGEIDSLASVLLELKQSGSSDGISSAKKWVLDALNPERIADTMFDLYLSVLFESKKIRQDVAESMEVGLS